MPWRQRRHNGWKEDWPQKKKKSSNSWRNSSSWTLPSVPGLDLLERSLLSVDALIGDDPYIDDDLDDSSDNQKLLATIKGNIVGIQYYNGTVNNFEMVGLVREPNNPYDRNAVRVDNVSKQKVGHLNRHLAAAMSYIVDNKLARVEGIVPSGKNNQYSMPVNLTLWGKPERQNSVASALSRHNIQFQYPGGAMSTATASSSGVVSGYQPRSSSYTPQLLTQAEMKNELDSIFDSMKEHDKTSCMEPAKAIMTKLYPHQKRALQWMVNQENSNTLPPLWKERKGNYINIATNYQTTVRPPSINGGILADDMGLGKTLEVIALIMTNFCNGKPLAVPVEGLPPPKEVGSMSSKRKNGKVDTVFEKPVFEVKTKSKLEDVKSDVKVEIDIKTEVKMEQEIKIEVKREEGKKEEEEEEYQPKSGKGGKGKRATRKRKAGKKDKKNMKDVANVEENIESGRRPRRTIRKPAKYVYSGSEDEAMISSIVSQNKKCKTNTSVQEEIKSEVNVEHNEKEEEVFEMDMVENHWDDVVLPNTYDDLPEVLITEPESLPSMSNSTQASVNGTTSSQVDLVVISPLKSCNSEKTLRQTSSVVSNSSTANGTSVLNITDAIPANDTTVPETSDVVEANGTSVSGTTNVTQLNGTSVGNSKSSHDGNLALVPWLSFENIKVPSVNDGAPGTKTVMNDLPPLPSLPSEQTKMKPASRLSTGVSCASGASVNKVFTPAPILIQEWRTSDVATSSGSPDVLKKSTIVLSDEEDDDDDDDLPAIQLSHKAPSRTYTRGPRATLIVCPLSVMSNWLQQLKDHVHPHVDIRVYLYYGPDRVRDPKVLTSKDIVITTYNTLAMDFKANGEKSVLHKTQWLRIVLDEGHMIRNPSTMQSKAAIALKSERRWILTGTPIQNSMRDLWSLTVFLKLEPFCSDQQWWKRVISRPIAEGNKAALGRVQALMRAIALRRTKTQKIDGKPLVELPERNVYVQSVELSEEERKVYETMAKEGRLAIGRYFRAGTLLHHYGDVLSILLRLRQLCCHPALCNRARAKAEIEALIAQGAKEAESNVVVTDEAKKKLVEKLLNVLSQGGDEECCVCLDSLKLPVITACAHVFCRPCIEEVIRKDQEQAACPLCRADVKDKDLVEVPNEDKVEPPTPLAGPWQSSAKVDAMMQHLIQLQRDDPTIKSLVVSQFTSLLDLVQKPLSDIGIKFVCFDGRMNMKKRTEAISEFMKQGPDTPTVCLLSLKAGGVGVNLVSASRVFLLDPAWNPAAEEQCFDRCHRLGQTKDVIITKFIVKDSVEERMMDLQEKKRNLMAGAFGKKQTAEERQRTRIDDIRLLLDL
ncbi:helicase-like transcription factor [Antedon mediterranea]|uniref:helicase-like transcription factor n=1 Tax=Antedon mediterranea TaxID=105859 RepID=UPI003AF87965